MYKKSCFNFKSICLLAAIGFSTACVEQAYDLDNINKDDAKLNANIGAPIGSTEKITLGDILELESDGDIKTDDNGDYFFELQGESIDQTSKLAPVVIQAITSGKSITLDAAVAPLSRAAEYSANIDQSTEKVTVTATGISNEVKRIDYVMLRPQTSGEKSTLTIGADGLTIKQGFTISFPSYVVIEKADAADDSYTIDGTKIVFAKDVVGEHTIALNLPKLNFTGATDVYSNGALHFDMKVDAKGTVTGTTALAGATMKLQLETCAMSIASVKGRVKPAIPGIDNQVIQLSSVPDFFTKYDSKIDINDVMINFTVNNPVPTNLRLTADIVSYKGNNVLKKIAIGAGENPVIIPAEADGKKLILCAKESTPIPTDAERVIVPELNTLLQTIPDRVELQNIQITADEADVEIKLNNEYRVSVAYGFKANLAMGPDFYVNYADTITGLSGDLDDFELNNAVLTADVVNSLPMNLTFTNPTPVDKDGKALTGITIKMNSVVKAGSQTSPTNSKAELELTVTDTAKQKELDGFVLNIKASSTLEGDKANYTPVALNKDQYVKFSNIRVKAKGSYTVKL